MLADRRSVPRRVPVRLANRGQLQHTDRKLGAHRGHKTPWNVVKQRTTMTAREVE